MYLWVALIAILPWSKSLGGVIIVIISVFWLLDTSWRNKAFSLHTNLMLLIPYLFYFMIELIGVSYTPDTSFGWDNVVKKLSFFAIPIVFLSTEHRYRAKLHIVRPVFITSLLVLMIVSLINMAIKFKVNPNQPLLYFHLVDFIKMHPSYVSLFYISGILICTTEIAKRNYKYFILLVLYTIFIFMLLARTEIIILFVLGFCFVIIYMYNSKRIMLLMPVMASIFVLLIYLAPQYNTLYMRFSSLKKGKESIHSFSDIKNERVTLWQEALHASKNSTIIGYGTGSSFWYLKKMYGISYINRINNFHNQYIQEFFTHGIFGIFSIFFMIFTIIIQFLKKKNIELMFFLLSVSIAFFTECVLETQSGILYFIVFSLIAHKKSIQV